MPLVFFLKIMYYPNSRVEFSVQGERVTRSELVFQVEIATRISAAHTLSVAKR